MEKKSIIHLLNTWKINYYNKSLKLKEKMKKEARVKVDEIDVRFFFLHVFIIYAICLCGSIDWLGMYKLKKNSGKISKTSMLGAKHLTIHSNLFTHYE